MAQAAMSGSASDDGVIRLRLIDRSPTGEQEVIFQVDVDEARGYLRKRGMMK